VAYPASPPDTPSHQSPAALEWTAPLSVRHIGRDAEELSKIHEGERPSSRKTAAHPMTTADRNKYWPRVRRVDGAHGDRTLLCSCPSIDAHES